ncbi:hypothetical protein Pmani_025999 [Petrolisthes manimaculis]|uniref:Uncharacterized protein n=1 Tax=Petrolisthes manimaculis TaxID=1843537 RepID=A0AAE1P703_9EUCA|nr:hypothetical protein Pmani_025999 [Petrolisthes manimaculis]
MTTQANLSPSQNTQRPESYLRLFFLDSTVEDSVTRGSQPAVDDPLRRTLEGHIRGEEEGRRGTLGGGWMGRRDTRREGHWRDTLGGRGRGWGGDTLGGTRRDGEEGHVRGEGEGWEMRDTREGR